MSAIDKAKNAAQSARGKVTQLAGAALHRPATEDKGRRKQAGADFKDAGEQIKDAGHNVKKAFDN